MEELDLPELTAEQMEALCLTAENAARRHVLANFSAKMVARLNVSVEVDGAKPVSLTVEIDLSLAPQMTEVDLGELVNEAAKEALRVSENYLRKLT